MELYDVMRTTFAAREFTADPLPDEVAGEDPRPRALRAERRQPSGLARHRRPRPRHEARAGRPERLCRPALRRPGGERREPLEHDRPAARRCRHHRADAGSAAPDRVDRDRARGAGRVRRPEGRGLDRPGPRARRDHQRRVDLPLRVERSARGAPRGLRRHHHHARHRAEPEIKALLGIPPHIAVCAVMPLGRPVRTLSRLKRKPVAEFATRERWDGPAFRSVNQIALSALSRSRSSGPSESHSL